MIQNWRSSVTVYVALNASMVYPADSCLPVTRTVLKQIKQLMPCDSQSTPVFSYTKDPGEITTESPQLASNIHLGQKKTNRRLVIYDQYLAQNWCSTGSY